MSNQVISQSLREGEHSNIPHLEFLKHILEIGLFTGLFIRNWFVMVKKSDF